MARNTNARYQEQWKMYAIIAWSPSMFFFVYLKSINKRNVFLYQHIFFKLDHIMHIQILLTFVCDKLTESENAFTNINENHFTQTSQTRLTVYLYLGMSDCNWHCFAKITYNFELIVSNKILYARILSVYYDTFTRAPTSSLKSLKYQNRSLEYQ